MGKKTQAFKYHKIYTVLDWKQLWANENSLFIGYITHHFEVGTFKFFWW